MELITAAQEVRAWLAERRRDSRSIGLVPTMGYLHPGHASLIERAASESDDTVVTVFVNPLQFAPGEDYETYPRDIERDAALAETAGAAAMFAPPVSEMYPDGEVLTTVSVRGVSEGLEGADRPTHFDGVATVVTKLFSLINADRAYFGEKDFQQLAVIRRMARDLSMGVEVVACPTIREPDGLAMSSRNSYLSATERAAAPALYRALVAGTTLVESGETDPARVRETMAEMLADSLFELDYLEVVDASTMVVPDVLAGEVRLLGAARLGRTRLIDNVGAMARG